MNGKILNMCALLASLFGYLEWGGGHAMFLFQAEAEVLSKLFTAPGEVLHPLTLLPLAGQIALLVTLFQARPGKWLTLAGLSALGLLLGLMFFIGLIDGNIAILGSTIPFLAVVLLIVRNIRTAYH